MNWEDPRYDKHAFAGRRTRAVSKESRLSFQDFSRMSVHHREEIQERRLPTPIWAIRDEMLRELLVVHLEERFYVRKSEGLTLAERLTRAKLTAEAYAPRKRELLQDWLNDYHTIATCGRADLTDEEAISIFISLRVVNGQLPLNADIAREYLASKKLHDLEIQIQNIDTDIVLTERGHAEIINAVVYMYYRLGHNSVEVAEQLRLKSPHVRQVLARMHSTWTQSVAYKFKVVEPQEDTRAPEPLEAIFGDPECSSQ